MTIFDTLGAFLSVHFAALTAVILIAFAALLVHARNRKSLEAKSILDKAIALQADQPFTLHPEIDPAICSGCGACTVACPEGDILKLIDHKAVLVSPTKCVGHGECEAACPTGAITLVFGTKTRGMDIPRITTNYETNIPGIYIAGELGGMGLIRNAIRQGNMAATHALDNLPAKRAPEVETDLFIIGSGPAGLAASLTAIAARKSYICIEQNSFGGTVYNFPRQKIVMLQKAELPLVGTLGAKGGKLSKEDLLALWTDAREKTGLTVREHVKFETLIKHVGHFEIKTTAGSFRASKVVLCTGVRGSPRRLGLANEDTAKVAYSLIDAEEYKSQYIAVVGSGNAACEAVQQLAQPKLGNRVTMLIRDADFDRCNDENKAKVLALAAQNLVTLWYTSTVTAIEPDRLVVKTHDGERSLANQFLFIFAGAELPSRFLMSLGVEIDKKFGVPLGDPQSHRGRRS